jgi:hypothetical protein
VQGYAFDAQRAQTSFGPPAVARLRADLFRQLTAGMTPQRR